VILHLDHIVVPTTRKHRQELTRRLVDAGFVHVESGRSDENGVEHHLLSFNGGAFLELACELEPRACPLDGLFDITTRVAGVGFSSNDLDADLTAWSDDEEAPDAWYWEHEWFGGDDTRNFYRAAGPIPVGQSYLFLMDTDQTNYHHVESDARLREIVFHGTDHELWRERYRRWLRLPAADDSFDVAGVRLRFEPDDDEGIEVRLVFDVPSGGGSVQLARSTFELRTPTTTGG
jgi:hypothetical protein